MVDGRDRLADDKSGVVEIDVLPPQTAELGSTQPGHRRQAHHGG